MEQLINETELLLQIAAGNEEAFRKIFHQYGNLIHANIYAIIKSDVISKDLVQDTFLRVWFYRDKLPELKNFKQWLLRISYNRAFTYLRDKSICDRNINHYADKHMPNSSDNQTEASVMLSALHKAIKDIILKMPPQQKNIYQLSREQGLKNAEIAAQLGISPNTVKNTLGKALQTLRDGMTKAGFELSILVILQIV